MNKRIYNLLLLGGVFISSKSLCVTQAKPISHVTRKTHYNTERKSRENDVIHGIRGGEATKHSRQILQLHSSPSLIQKKSQTSKHIDRGGAAVRSKKVVDNTKAPLNLIRVLFLSFYGSLGVLMPYLPVYYHSLGHDGMYIGLLGAVKPLTTFLVAPAWGILSDRTNAHSTILQYTFVLGLLLQISVCLYDSIGWLVTTVFLSALINAPVKSLMDNLVMNALPQENKTQYGKMRLWGQVGFGFGSSGIGVLLHKTLRIVNEATGSPESTTTALAVILHWIQDNVLSKLTGYNVAFFAHGLLSIPTLLCMQTFRRIEKKITSEVSSIEATKKGSEGAKIIQGLKHLARDSDAIIFFFLVLVVGISSGCIENFAYVRMREVGGTGKEMGLSRLVSSATGAPMFWFSGALTKFFGEETILIMSLLSYVTRFFIYAFMQHPLQGLPAEALRGLTFAAFWSTGTIYAHKISPPGMSATMLMFLNAMYGGLGQSLGAIIGGKLQSKFGTVLTFIYAGAFDLCFVTFFACFLRLRRRRAAMEKEL